MTKLIRNRQIGVTQINTKGETAGRESGVEEILTQKKVPARMELTAISNIGRGKVTPKFRCQRFEIDGKFLT